MKKKIKLIKVGIIVIQILFIGVLAFGSVLFVRNKNKVLYSEGTKVTYGIKLKDGTIYSNEDQLDFLTSDIEKVTVNIEYFNTDENVKTAGYAISAYSTTYVNSTVDQHVQGVLNPREIIKNNERVISNVTNITFEIDYQAKINEVKEYINSQKLESKISTGVIELSLVSGEKKTIINVSLLEDELKITEIESIDNEVKESTILSILLITGSVVVIVVLLGVYLVAHKLSSLSDYDLNVISIFKFNKDILIEGKIQESDINDSVVVTSFKELVKVQNMISLPIIYNKINDQYFFLIKAGNNKYSYILDK